MRKYRFALLSLVAAGIALLAFRTYWHHAPNLQLDTRALPVQTPVIPSPLSEALLGRVVGELAQIQTGTTAAEWRHVHPEDSQENPGDDPEEPGVDTSCAKLAGTEHLTEGIVLRRVAVFYLPSPSQPLVLPAQTDTTQLVGSCLLGSIKTELTGDRNELLLVLPALRSALSARFGAPVQKRVEVLTALGSVWQSGPATILIEKNLATDPTVSTKAILSEHVRTRGPLPVYAFLPSFEAEHEGKLDNRYGRVTPQTSPEVFASAMRTAAIPDAELSQAMTDLHQDCLQSPA